jgi:N6-L-threonylcarbamoyladenine synthase
MICLGIESTAHTFGVGIVRQEGSEVEVLANVKDAYTSEKEGIVPNEAANHHVACFEQVLSDALAKAGLIFTGPRAWALPAYWSFCGKGALISA